ncbi:MULTISPECIES: Sapep family Mn(2+)-dependent dipeptidase [Terrabacteria group]|uniref:Sapep family Mn(2+)-dependent dipeptidase n=1 Tax=Bacillati TaxID=1783272 RepID=UPI001939EF62|nr:MULTISPECIES: Sapep family Mn(2+)-dependent dipeptidase [Terrabacteria group]MBW9212717.1 Sapep family Mn(2+)-dependent dipeptidase [Trueperella sp. zg.1013]QRG86544.1 Sapep family Mn(2+)-dependent dipeptidase [Bulleidia sp. zg-1006]
MTVKEKVQANRQELLKRLATLVSINSEMGEASVDAPFGSGPKKALETALKMMEADGFAVRNVDNYIGYGEIGQGDEIIGVIAHLDVVPAHKEDGWNSDPFEMVEKDGIVYGRGVSDDKGAAVASMIALKIIQESGIPLNKRIRLILGTNEENGSKCLEHYVEKLGSVDYGFTPDGDFPAIHGEKGLMRGYYSSKDSHILDIVGGSAENVVARQCMVKVEKNTFSKKVLEDFFNDHNINFSLECDDKACTLVVEGVAAHASLPHLGVNAISYALVGLKEAGYQDSFVEFYCSHFGLSTDGSGMNAKCEDEFGSLTMNTGVITMKDGVIRGSIDARFPVTKSVKEMLKMVADRLEDEGGQVVFDAMAEPLYFPPDAPLIKSLVSAYQEVTGDYEAKPFVIGGGTYAKEIKNTIAFGCAFPGTDYHIHDANEFCPVDELLLQTEIYIRGIEKLLEL